METLETLDLSHNSLSWALERTRDLFSKLNDFRKLRLNNNRTRLLQSNTFDRIKRLKELDLSHNPLTTIEAEVFVNLESLEELNLNSSSLFCDCSFRPFVEWLRSSPVRQRFAKTVHCSSPEKLREKTKSSIFDASDSDYDCRDRRRPVLMDNFKAFNKAVLAIKHKSSAFYCKVATSVPVKFSWIKDNKLIEDFTNHPRIVSKTLPSKRSDNSTLFTNILQLSDVNNEDEGQYQCKASNQFGVVYSHPFDLNVYVTPNL